MQIDSNKRKRTANKFVYQSVLKKCQSDAKDPGI